MLARPTNRLLAFCLAILGVGGPINLAGADDLATWGHPLPAGNPLTGLAFADAQRGWAVGLSGVVLRTVDGGDHWELVDGTWQQLPDLLDLLAIDAQTLVAVGGGAGVYRSTDGGLSWAAVTVAMGDRLNDIEMVDGRLVAIGDGGVVVTSDDLGHTWLNRASPGDGILADQHWFDTQHGIVVAGEVLRFDAFVARTEDGGQSWIPIDEDVAGVQAITHAGGQTCYVSGDGTTLRTDDGGVTWQDEAFLLPPYVVQFEVEADGTWLVGLFGEGARIGRSVDQGSTWDFPFNADGAQLGVAEFTRLGSGRMVAVLDSGDLVTSDDDGATWVGRRQDHTAMAGADIAAVDLGPGGIGLATATWGTHPDLQAIMMESRDGGRSWQPAAGPGGWRALGMVLVRSSDTRFVVGRDQNLETGRLARSTDGGQTWQAISVPGTSAMLNLCSPVEGVLMVSAFTNASNRIWRSEDDGDTWALASAGLPTSQWLLGLSFVDAQVGYTSGGFASSVLFRTVDGGATWQPRAASGLGGYARKLHFITADVGVAVCENDGVYRTIDGGATWTEVLDGQIIALDLDASGRGVAAGRHEDTVFWTDDGGQSWRLLALPWQGWNPRADDIFIYTSYAARGGDLVVGGQYATLLHVGIDTDVTPVVPASSASIALHAAPNPFNPATTIGFALPAAARTRIELFDARGRRVRTLAEGHLAAGAHQLRWNGRDGGGRPVAAGVYLVRVTSGHKAAAMKITLAK